MRLQATEAAAFITTRKQMIHRLTVTQVGAADAVAADRLGTTIHVRVVPVAVFPGPARTRIRLTTPGRFVGPARSSIG